MAMETKKMTTRMMTNLHNLCDFLIILLRSIDDISLSDFRKYFTPFGFKCNLLILTNRF